MRFGFLLPLLLAGAFGFLGCVSEPDTTTQSEVKATVDPTVSATIPAITEKAVGGTPARPEPTRLRPTVTNAPTVTPFPTRRPESIPRPTLLPVNTPAKRAQTITSSLGQQVDATVTGFDDSPLRFEQLVTAINEGERLLGVPYPSPIVNMTRVDEISGGFCGHNQMSYAPRYSGDPYVVDGSFIKVRVNEDCFKTFDTIVHEVAHTWFHGSDSANWIDEGLANAIENQVVEANQTDDIIYLPVTYCETYSNIKELERGNPVRIANDPYTGFNCNYSLGDGIFGALLEHFGEMEFNSRIATLARRPINQSDREHKIADVRNALGRDSAALAIISTWYEGYPQMRKYRHLAAVEWTFPPTIDGDYMHFAGRTREPGLVHDFILGDDPYCSQFTLYRNVINQEWVASVSDPLLVGWTHGEIPKAVAVNDRINPETGEFSITTRINDQTLYQIPELSLLVRSRELVGSNNLCGEGDSYSQIAVSTGQIPPELKVSKHYHLDAIEWIAPPTISGTTLTFRGRAQPGTIALEWRDGYCGQFSFYDRDEIGYHYIDSLNPFLPGGRSWTGTITGEVTRYNVAEDGTFEANASLIGNALSGYDNVVLVVRTLAAVDPGSRKCGASDVMSAIDIH